MSNRKTKKVKDEQCRYCGLADKTKFRNLEASCTLPNPKIKGGRCEDQEPLAKPISKAGRD